jgi:hypothetical protein
MSKLQDYLKEQPPLERFDVSKEIMKEIASLGKDLITLSKRAKNMEGGEALSRLNDFYDELWSIKDDLETYLRPHG